MLGPNAICGRIFLALLITTIVYFAYMNYLLYIRVHDYKFRGDANTSFEESLPNYESTISCDVNPLCDVTVKSLMLDNPNHYILGPLASIVDKTLGISDCWTWISPNHISAFHVLVAIAAGKCVSSDSLSQRRFGVILFMIRTWLDDLDGHVARRRRNIRGEYSEVGSVGYLVDGLCDALGVLSFLAGVYYFMKNNPPRRGYEKLLPTLETKEFGSGGTVYRKKQNSGKEIPWTMALFIVQLLFSSAGWNRYIAVYQDLLETKGSFNSRERFQILIIRSAYFWSVSILWTVINIHAITDYLLFAIFIDKLWEFLRLIRYLGYFLILIATAATEYHYRIVYQEFDNYFNSKNDNSKLFFISVFDNIHDQSYDKII